MQNWILYVCLGISLFIVCGWKYVRSLQDEEKSYTCPKCGKVNLYSIFCRDCGTRIRPDVQCPKCGFICTGQYCGNCGTELKR